MDVTFEPTETTVNFMQWWHVIWCDAISRMWGTNLVSRYGSGSHRSPRLAISAPTTIVSMWPAYLDAQGVPPLVPRPPERLWNQRGRGTKTSVWLKFPTPLGSSCVFVHHFLPSRHQLHWKQMHMLRGGGKHVLYNSDYLLWNCRGSPKEKTATKTAKNNLT